MPRTPGGTDFPKPAMGRPKPKVLEPCGWCWKTFTPRELRKHLASCTARALKVAAYERFAAALPPHLLAGEHEARRRRRF
jgi:hypothetical protein